MENVKWEIENGRRVWKMFDVKWKMEEGKAQRAQRKAFSSSHNLIWRLDAG